MREIIRFNLNSENKAPRILIFVCNISLLALSSNNVLENNTSGNTKLTFLCILLFYEFLNYV